MKPRTPALQRTYIVPLFFRERGARVRECGSPIREHLHRTAFVAVQVFVKIFVDGLTPLSRRAVEIYTRLRSPEKLKEAQETLAEIEEKMNAPREG